MKLKEMFRDWWRGYSDEDMRSVRAKISPKNPEFHRPDGMIQLSWGEMNAHMAFFRDIALQDAIDRRLPSHVWP